MMHTLFRSMLALAAIVFASAAAQSDPLSSWNEGPAKQSIMTFVQGVADPTGKDYMPPDERIAVFNNDGTLWSEKPAYFQLLFAIDPSAASTRRSTWQRKMAGSSST